MSTTVDDGHEQIDRKKWANASAGDSRKTELTATEWWDAIKLGIKYREEEGKSDKWEELRQYYKNEFPEKTQVYNLIYMAVEDLRSLLVARAPGVQITTEEDTLVEYAPILEAIDNKLIRIMGLRRQLSETTVDAVLHGARILKVGYDSQYGYFPLEMEAEHPERIVGDATDTQFGKRGEWLEYTQAINPGMPWVQRVSNWMFVVPYGTAGVDSAMWAAHNFYRTLDDVKADPKYKNTSNLDRFVKELRESSKSKGDISGDDQKNPLPGVPRGVKVLSLWEIRDVKTGKLYVICEGYDRFLRVADDVLQGAMNSLPYVAFAPHAIPDCFWGLSDASYLLGLQKEVNDARSQYREMRQRAIQKCGVERGSMDENDIQNFQSNKMKGVFEYKPGSNPPFVYNPGIPGDIPEYIKYCIQEGRDVLGLPRIARGAESGPPRKTRGEVEYMMAGANIKPDLRRGAISEMVVNAMSKVNDIIFKFWTEDRVVRMIGKDGQEAATVFRATDMAGEYMMEVRSDTMAPVDRNSRMAIALNLFKMFAADPYVDPVKLRRAVFAELDGYDPVEMVPNTPPGQPTPGAGVASMGAGPQGELPNA